jgi:hypothetical protein
MRYKRNQVEEAIVRTLRARDARVNELKLRLKRLLVTDRRLDRDAESDERSKVRYAFFSEGPPGSGVEIMFSRYETFALLAALMVLEHGIPQAGVVRVMRRVRRKLEAAHAQILQKDPGALFDQQAILAQAKPGMIATDNTDPVFLVFIRLPGSEVGAEPGGSAVAVCQGRDELAAFVKKHSVLGMSATFFEFVRMMHTLADNLAQTRPVKRGR